MTRAAVILAGGAGTRLRPLSSDENPKQFLKLFDGKSLLQLTWDRVARLLPPEAIFVSTNVQSAIAGAVLRRAGSAITFSAGMRGSCSRHFAAYCALVDT